jgi:hypothetical protein
VTDESAVKATPQVEVPREVDRIRDIILGPQLREYEQRFQIIQRDLERLQQGLDHLIEQLANQDGEQNKKLQTLRRDMRQGDDDLRGELRQTSQKLTTDKVDRMALGELFVELGTHLKMGGSLADLLKGLDDTTK